MSIRVPARALWNTVAIAGLIAGAAALSGCTALGARAFGDPTVTGSTSRGEAGSPNQPMPSLLGGQSTRVAASPYVPPADIGGGGGGMSPVSVSPIGSPVVQSQALPPINSMSGPSAMPAQQNLAPAMPAPQSLPPPASMPAPAPVMPAPQVAAAPPNLQVVPQDAYVHVIQSGESLYAIARRYNVTAQAIVQANGFGSPDKIYVGQRLIIPGMSGQSAQTTNQPPSNALAAMPADNDVPSRAPMVTTPPPPTTTAAIANPALLESNMPVRPTTQPIPQQVAPAAPPPAQTAALTPQPPAAAAAEPQMSGADKFRWPISGKVITDFAASKGTGINIEAPEGAPVRAAENGTVIYVGSGVEGYGNLILIRHPNGYVSAYAHLKVMTVQKGDVVNRGDSIGQAGMTGSVNRPQLHFELRKGATPVDPMPLLAG